MQICQCSDATLGKAPASASRANHLFVARAYQTCAPDNTTAREHCNMGIMQGTLGSAAGPNVRARTVIYTPHIMALSQ